MDADYTELVAYLLIVYATGFAGSAKVLAFKKLSEIST